MSRSTSSTRSFRCLRCVVGIVRSGLVGETSTDLAVGFAFGVSTAYRYIRESIAVLAALAPTLGEAIAVATGKAHVVLDGSLLRIDRVAMASHRDRPYDSGEHKAHGVNVQVVADPAGRLTGSSGSRHDIAAAREHGVLDAFDAAGVKALADTGYQGAGRAGRVPTALTPPCGHPVNAPTPS